jgi:hypothetical protein
MKFVDYLYKQIWETRYTSVNVGYVCVVQEVKEIMQPWQTTKCPINRSVHRDIYTRPWLSYDFPKYIWNEEWKGDKNYENSIRRKFITIIT